MSAAAEEWGSWIAHDGAGLPDHLRGRVVIIEVEAPPGYAWDVLGDVVFRCVEITAGNEGGVFIWDWRYFGVVHGRTIYERVLRYRVKKPSYMLTLDKYLNVESPADA